MQENRSITGWTLEVSRLMKSAAGLFNSRICSLVLSCAFGVSVLALFISFFEKKK
ncbi:MAG: hypothetical protein IJF27_05370 [Oscillospiraceae bacterium]|nr:hypothetical protein [Oscillospiraceae bacterium]MBQ3049290.1 hypothetical protein [Oscillospiraceae bacterium]